MPSLSAPLRNLFVPVFLNCWLGKSLERNWLLTILFHSFIKQAVAIKECRCILCSNSINNGFSHNRKSMICRKISDNDKSKKYYIFLVISLSFLILY